VPQRPAEIGRHDADRLDPAQAEASPELAEKIIRKLRTG
jgi:hypothetical protein